MHSPAPSLGFSPQPAGAAQQPGAGGRASRCQSEARVRVHAPASAVYVVPRRHLLPIRTSSQFKRATFPATRGLAP